MTKEFTRLLIDGAEDYGAKIGEKELQVLLEYKRILLLWNEKHNLTSILEDREIIIKHYLDSISILPFLRDVSSLVDVGSGAGFPGIPLKIVKPSLKLLLADSLNKRVSFLEEVIRTLDLTDVRAVHLRAEDMGKMTEFREMSDAATARAVAALPVLAEYCLPLVKVGGIFIAMKGDNISELSEAERALEILGGRVEDVKEFALPASDIRRSIIVIRKFRQTPAQYPRKAGKPAKMPLI